MSEKSAIKTLLDLASQKGISSKINYLTYKAAVGYSLDEYDLNCLSDIVLFFNNIGNDGVDIEDYINFAILNLLLNNNDVAFSIIRELQKELETDLFVPGNDVFYLYRKIAIAESLTYLDSKSLEIADELVKLLPKKNKLLNSSLSKLAITFVDAIHLNEENYSKVGTIEEIINRITTRKERDEIRGEVARKMVARSESDYSLNRKLINYAEKNIAHEIEDRFESIFTKSQIAGAKLNLGKTENDLELIDAANKNIREIREDKKKVSVQTRLFRDIALLELFNKIDMKDEAANAFERIKEEIEKMHRVEDKENVISGVVYLFTSTLFTGRFANETEAQEVIGYADSILEHVGKETILWSYIDMSSSLSRQGYTKLSLLQFGKAEALYEVMKLIWGEEHVLETLIMGLTENYFYTFDELFLKNVLSLVEMSSVETKRDISAGVFASLSRLGINKKFNVSIGV